MSSSPSRPTAGNIVAAGILAIALAIVVGTAALGAVRQVASSPAPTPAATPSPASPATPAPATPAPATPAPTADPTNGLTVILDTVDEIDPRVVVNDQTGTLAGVVTGHAGDGMSVRWNKAIVDQVDPRTIRVTWVGFPGEEQVGLAIDAKDGAPVLVFDQMAPYANTDALGADRVLVLTFDSAVNAADVEVAFPSLEPSY
jgi:hypothetical protein